MSKAAELANLIGNINAGGGGVGRNLFDNGSMIIAQRGTSITNATATTLDRWNISQTTDGQVTITQDSSVPSGSGLANSYKLDVTTADTSLSSAQRVFPHQIIEAQNLQHLQYGTSNAKPLTLSFYVKSNVTGTYTVLFSNFDANRHRASTYTIDSANTWEQKKITISGDTAGAINDDIDGNFEIAWWLAAGTAYTSGTLGTDWQASDATDKVSSSNVNIMSSTDNEWFLTGCQLEIGQNATTFEFEPFERTLLKCKRYLQVYGGSSYAHFPSLGQGSSSSINWNHELPIEMRDTPTLETSGDWRVQDTYGGSYYTLSSIAISSGDSTTKLVRGSATTSSAIGTDIGRILSYGDSSARWIYKSELG